MTPKTEQPLRWPGRVASDSVHFCRPPLAYLVRHGDRPVLVNENLLDEIASGQSNSGVLLGVFCADDDGPFVVAERCLPAASLTEAHAEAQRRFPGLGIVGWYRGRSGGGTALGEKDEEFCRKAFPTGGQAGLIFDSRSRMAVAYHWDGNTINTAGVFLYRPSEQFRQLVVYEEQPPDPATLPPEPAFVSRDGTPWRYRPSSSYRHRSTRRSRASANERGHESEPLPVEPIPAPKVEDSEMKQAIISEIASHLGESYEVISNQDTSPTIRLRVRLRGNSPQIPELLRRDGVKIEIDPNAMTRPPRIDYKGLPVLPDQESWWADHTNQGQEILRVHAELIRDVIADLQRRGE